MNRNPVVFMIHLFTIFTVICVSTYFNSRYYQSPCFQFCQGEKLKVTDQVFFVISIDGVNVGKIVIGLFGETTPKTVENFKQIASEGIDGRTYAGTEFHRVIKRFMIQGIGISHYMSSKKSKVARSIKCKC